MTKILIVDDEAYIRRSLTDILTDEKYNVEEAANGKQCIRLIESSKYDVILLDIKMPELDGMDVLEVLTEKIPETPVIMMSGHGSIDTAVEAVKKGAFDFISKPADLNRLLITIRNAMDKGQLTKEVKISRHTKKRPGPEMIGTSPKMEDLRNKIALTAASEARVLITGPNGSGKELVARAIHFESDRSDGPFIEVNCAAIPSELIESELFGHEKGSFTGAGKTTKGKFEQANGGTIFLDEIGDMSESAQAKVLRALQENRITRVGGDKDIPVNCRVIAATNKDLFDMILKYQFREDLYYRLAVVNLEVPSLNDRKEDIPLLVHHFINSFCTERNKPARLVSDAAMKALTTFNYRGNIRELRNIIERILVLGSPEICEKDIIDHVLSKSNPTKMMMKRLVARLGGPEKAISYIRKEYGEVQV